MYRRREGWYEEFYQCNATFRKETQRNLRHMTNSSYCKRLEFMDIELTYTKSIVPTQNANEKKTPHNHIAL
jgi:hypothetical protein